jgi:hypothetical protein
MDEQENLETNDLETQALLDAIRALEQQVAELHAKNQHLEYLAGQVEDLQLNLEIANERWVASVNENAATEVRLRKLLKKGNAQ